MPALASGVPGINSGSVPGTLGGGDANGGGAGGGGSGVESTGCGGGGSTEGLLKMVMSPSLFWAGAATMPAPACGAATASNAASKEEADAGAVFCVPGPE